MTDRRDREALDSADLERTAEMPALERAGHAPARAREDLGSTDTWVVPRPQELRSLEARLAAEAARAAEAEAQLGKALAERAAALERVERLERELADARSALAATAPPPQRDLEARLAERARALESAQRRLGELEREHVAQLEALYTQEGRRTVFDALLRGLESDLSEREMRLAELETEVRAKDALLKVLGQPPAPEEARPAAEPDRSEVGPTLVRLDDGAAAAYALGCRTRIGRTRDNDVRVGAPFASRHHALILVSAAETIVEDLNSTNGVLVNGRRIGRQDLKDGDEIELGQARFRFVMRGMV